ncbi:MAG: ABC transporter substrate-binding protein [Clostridia bacterium]|nr:ABC transporter substrate-binding protein [Clostridia bacterium]
MKKLSIILIILLIAATTLAGCSKEEGHTKITVVLDWTPNTNHTGLYTALEKHYFIDEGLLVEIIQPTEGTAEQLVAANTAQFGISYQENVTFARAAGVPIVSIAAIIQHNTSGFISPADENITSPADFAGKKYGGWGTDIETAIVKHLMVEDGADPDDVNIVTIGDTEFFAACDADEIDFGWAYEAWTLQDAVLKGRDVNYFSMISFSEELDFYTPVIITNENNIKNNKKLVEKFMRAVKKGYEYAIAHPQSAAGDLLNHVPELDFDLVWASQLFLADKYQADADMWGIQDKSRWDNYTNWLYENGLIESNIKTEDAFTNEFIK